MYFPSYLLSIALLLLPLLLFLNTLFMFLNTLFMFLNTLFMFLSLLLFILFFEAFPGNSTIFFRYSKSITPCYSWQYDLVAYPS